MADSKSILARLLTSLSVTDPSWDTSVGSATYKIMESVASELSNVANNGTLLSFGYNINTKAGTELDAFVNLFGIVRQQGTRATGVVTFNASVASSTISYDIPLGTTVYAPSSTMGITIAFTTTSPAVLNVGQTSVDVPVICSLPGTQGNIAASTVTQLGTPLMGISSVNNGSTFNYGTDPETDSQLRQRFINTAFSNFAGTAAKYQSVAQQLPTTNRTNVVSAQSVYNEALPIYTIISGNSSFRIGLNNQAVLSGTSGQTTATLYQGKVPFYSTLVVASSSPANAYSGTVNYDGTNYTLSSGAGANCLIYLNTTITGATTYSGASTASYVASGATVLLSGYGYPSVTVTTTGLAPSGVMGVTFSQYTPWNLVIASGTVSGTNNIVSQVPDSKYCYPVGGETVGIGLGTSTQTVFTSATDYTYIQATGTAPLYPQINFIPNYANAPYTYTGSLVQLRTQYTPISSRTVISGNAIVNPNYVDIFIDDATTSTVTEQVVMNTNNVLASTGTYSVSNYLMGNGSVPPTGDYYLDVAQGPVANFPYQVNAGTPPSYLTFGVYEYPLSLTLQSGVTVTGIVASSGTQTLTTLQSISGLQLGLVASGTTVGTGNYITSLTPGTPNIIGLRNNVPSTISGSSLTWVSVCYPLYDNTTSAGSVLDVTGIALRNSDPTGAYGSNYPKNFNYQSGILVHDYYSNVSAIDNVEQQSRVVGTNLLTHEVSWASLRVYLSVVYNSTLSIASANTGIQNAVATYLSTVPIGGVVSVGSLLQAVYQVAGVNTARLTNSNEDSTYYGIWSVNPDGSLKTRYTTDILLSNNQAPKLVSVIYKSYGLSGY